MDYFDKQDNKAAQQQESYNHNQAQEQQGYHIQSKNVFPDNWKVPQDGDFDFVSVIRDCCSVIHCGNVYSSKTEAALSVVTHFFCLLFVCVASQLKNLDFEELQLRLTALDPMMEREIEELRQRYTAKRQPILDAMDAKKRRQQNF